MSNKSVPRKGNNKGFTYKDKNKELNINYKLYFYIIFGFGIFFRILFACSSSGYKIDMNCFKGWAYWASKDFIHFYNPKLFTDYPPLYIYVLYFLGKIFSIFNLGTNQLAQNFIIKVPSMTADLISAFMMYKLSQKYLNRKWGLIISAAYIFNPLTILNSSIWGQIDSFFTMFIIFALILIDKNKIAASSAVFVAAVLLKPQGIIFLPVIFFILIRCKNLKMFLGALAISFSTAFLIILPFYFNHEPLWIFKLYMKTISEYPYATMNALNLFFITGGNFINASNTLILLGNKTFFSYKILGYGFIVIVSLFTGYLLLKGKGRSIPAISSLFLVTGVFVLSSGMHERYMFPTAAFALLVFIFVKDIRMLIIYAAVSLTGFINTFIVYNYAKTDIYQIPQSNMATSIICLLNILVLIYLIRISIDIVNNDKDN